MTLSLRVFFLFFWTVLKISFSSSKIHHRMVRNSKVFLFQSLRNRCDGQLSGHLLDVGQVWQMKKLSRINE